MSAPSAARAAPAPPLAAARGGGGPRPRGGPRRGAVARCGGRSGRRVPPTPGAWRVLGCGWSPARPGAPAGRGEGGGVWESRGALGCGCETTPPGSPGGARTAGGPRGELPLPGSRSALRVSCRAGRGPGCGTRGEGEPWRTPLQRRGGDGGTCLRRGGAGAVRVGSGGTGTRK